MKKGRGTILAGMAVVLAGALVYYRVTFPFGQSHCRVVGTSLRMHRPAE
jgi:hypothetical protein